MRRVLEFDVTVHPPSGDEAKLIDWRRAESQSRAPLIALRQVSVTTPAGITASSAPPKRDPEENWTKDSKESKALRVWVLELVKIIIVDSFESEFEAEGSSKPQYQKVEDAEEAHGTSLDRFCLT